MLFFRDLDLDLAPLTLLGDIVPRAACCAAFGVRHRWPVAVAAGAPLACLVSYPLSSADGATPVIALVAALYTVARAGRLASARDCRCRRPPPRA